MPRADSVEDAGQEAEPEPPRGLTVEVVEEAGRWTEIGEFELLVAGVVAAVGRHRRLRGFMPAEACIALLDDAGMRQLNSRYRAKDKPTNVLSFPSGIDAPVGQRRPLGDIALGYETVVREAAEQNKPVADHVRHLVLHGLLHLMGYDHETDAEAEAMEALEIEILTGLGLADPYQEAAPAPARR